MSLVYNVGAPPPVEALCNLRESVGWDRADGDYPAAFRGYATCVTAHTPEGRLVGWCAVVSDGVRHGFLVDVIVAPAWQRRGVGRRLVECALAELRECGISIVHVDFLPEHKGFYESCGFRLSVAGIIDAPSPHTRYSPP
jgi:ribosomal protein S18 acetylase RimI-like enzyme